MARRLVQARLPPHPQGLLLLHRHPPLGLRPPGLHQQRRLRALQRGERGLHGQGHLLLGEGNALGYVILLHYDENPF